MNGVYELFRPSLFVKSILEIQKNLMTNSKIKIVFIDVDNTIVSYKKKEMESSYIDFLIEVSKNKRVILITNNSKKRVLSIPQLNKFECICKAQKPLPFCYMKVLEKYKIKKEESIVIGDQLFDDILAGNLIGIYTILICPIEAENLLRIRIKRYFELKILNRMEMYSK